MGKTGRALLNVVLSLVLVVGLFPQVSLAEVANQAAQSNVYASSSSDELQLNSNASGEEEGSESAADNAGAAAGTNESAVAATEAAAQDEAEAVAAETAAEAEATGEAEVAATEEEAAEAESVAGTEELPEFEASALVPSEGNYNVALQGTGTEDDPYLVGTADELSAVALKVNSTSENTMVIKLTANIDLGNTAWDPMGKSTTYPFQGTFDGAGYTITGLSVDSDASYKGFIGYAIGATVKNVTLEGSVKGKDCTAAVAGYAKNSSFENIVSKVALSSVGNRVGGIVGEANGCTLTKCGNTANIHAESTATGTMNGFGTVGGLVGYAYSSFSLTSSYNTGDISATTYALRMGGLVGQVNVGTAVIKDVYNTGSFTYEREYSDYERIGGLIGDYSAGSSELVLQNAYQTGSFTVPNTEQTRLGYLIGYCYSKLTESYTNVKNLYYVPGDITNVFGSSTSSKSVSEPPAWQAASRDLDAIKAAGFASVLGSNFADDTTAEFNNGMPYLRWQNPDSSYAIKLSAGLSSDANHSESEALTLLVTNKDGEDVTSRFVASASNSSSAGVWTCDPAENGEEFHYTLSKRGYGTEEGTLTVNSSSIDEQVTLEPLTYSYAFTVSPASAAVTFMVNGNAVTLPQGVTNPNGSITYTIEGLYNSDALTYEVSKFAYESKTGTLDSVSFANGQASVELQAKTAYTATLNVALTGMPSDATLAQISADKLANSGEEVQAAQASEAEAALASNAEVEAAGAETAATTAAATEASEAEATAEATDPGDPELLPEADTSSHPALFIYYSAPSDAPDTDKAFNGKQVYNSDTDGGVTGTKGDLNFTFTVPNLIDGTYTYYIKYDGFPTKTGTFTVAGANVTESISMSPLTGDPWNGNYDIAWYLYHEDETEFYLDSAEDFAGLSYLVAGTALDYSGNKIAAQSFAGKTIYLTKDIDLGGNEGKYFTPIGILNRAMFAGMFDGQGHTISNLLIGVDPSDTPTARAHTGSTRAGLFTSIKGTESSHAAVRNITISNATVSRDKRNNTGGYAGILAGETEYTDIENVAVSGGSLNFEAATSSSATGGYIGGLVGYANNYTTFTGCSNSAAISSTGYDLGGIAGYLGKGSSATRCSNSGSITATGTKYQTTYSYGAGGIAGCVNYSAAGLYACYNTGTVSASVASVGGVAGLFGPNSTAFQTAQFVDCYNTGAVTNTSTSTSASQLNVGGLAGYVHVYASESRTINIVENCYNAGTVSAGEGAPDTMRVGGLFGTASEPYYLNKQYLFSNNWYNSNAVAEGVAAIAYLQQGSSTNQDMSGMLEPATEDTMKSAGFVGTLGASYAADFDTPINGGFPVLRWQNPNSKWATTFNMTLDTTANDDFVIESGAVKTEGSLPELTVRDSSGNVLDPSSAVEIKVNEDNTYSFQGGYELSNGAYTFSISKKGYNETLTAGEEGDTYTSLYQGSFVVASNSVVKDIELTATKYTYTLEVVGTNNVPVSDATVEIRNGSSQGETIEPTNAEGNLYTYALYNGSYWTSVTKYGYTPRVTSDDQLVQISYADAKNTPLLEKLSEYTLTINATPSADAFRDSVASLNLSCAYKTFETQTVTADSNGTVTFTNTLAQGTYDYEIRAGYYQKYKGQVEITNSDVTLNLTLEQLGPWDGKETDITWYDESATDLYISTPAELAGFAALVNGAAKDEAGEAIQDSFEGKTVHLLSSISLGNNQWTPIGNSTNAFSGSFDGGGCRIEGLSINPAEVTMSDRGRLGLFGHVSGATLHDVVVAGKIAGLCNTTYVCDAAGLAAYVASDGVTITRCGSEVDISLESSAIMHVGGLTGWSMGSTALESSYNKGTITVSSSKYGFFTGGLTGFVSGGIFTIKGCYNTGTVDARSSISVSMAAAGGFVGSINSGAGAFTISDSYETGAVTGINLLDPSTNVGALIGSRSSSNTSDLILNTYVKNGVADKTVGAGMTGTNATQTIEESAFNTDDLVAKLNANSTYFARNNQTTGTPLLTWERAIVSVEKVTNPVKLSYNDQEKFDSTGLSLRVTYTSGDPIVVESGWAVLNGASLTPTQTSVTVDYSGWQFDIPVEVTQIEHETISEIALQIDGPVAGNVANSTATILSRDDGYYFAKVTWTHAGEEFTGTFEEGAFYRANIEVYTYYEDDIAWYVLPEEVQVNVRTATGTPDVQDVLYAGRAENGRSYTLSATFAATSCATNGVSDSAFHLYYEGDSNASLYNSALATSPALTLSIEGEEQTFNVSDIEQLVLDSNTGYEGTYSNVEQGVYTQSTYTGLKLYSFLADKMGAYASDDTEITFVSTDGTEYSTTLGEIREPFGVYSDAATKTSTAPALLAFGKDGLPLMPYSSVGSLFTGPLMLVTGQMNARAAATAMQVSTIRIDKIQAQETQIVTFDVTCDGEKVNNPTIVLSDSYGNSFVASNNRYGVNVDEDFTYLVSAEGYTTVQGNVRVSDSAVTIPVELLKTYNGTPEKAKKAEDGYYEIYTAEQLVWWVENGSASDQVRLMNDVALNDGYTFDKDSSYSWPVSTFGKKEENAFQGTFDGNGHTIYGFYIYRENTIDLWAFWDGSVGMTSDNVSQIGLFGYTYGATIKNLGIDGRIDVLDRPDSMYASWMQIGAFVGYATSTTIENCTSNVGISHVTATGGGALTGVPFDGWPEKQDAHIGGICGTAARSTITNCYARGEITSGTCRSVNLGGIAGRALSYSSYITTISNCYSTMSMYASPKDNSSFTSYQGGIVGTMGSSGVPSVINNCVALNGTIDGGVAKKSITGRIVGGPTDVLELATFENNRGLSTISIENATFNDTSQGSGEELSPSASLAKQTYVGAGWQENTSSEVTATSTGWQFPSERFPLLYWQDANAAQTADQVSNGISGKTNRNPGANESGFSEYAPPEHFTLSIQVEGYDARQAVVLDATTIRGMASTTTLKYSAYSPYQNYGRVTTEYVPVEDLLSSQGISFGKGDTFVMGGLEMDYESYFETPRYYFPHWASDWNDTSDKVQVPTALVLKSYGGNGYTDDTLDIAVFSADYLYAYMTLFGQLKPSDQIADQYIHQQTSACVVYDAEGNMNSYLSSLLSSLVAAALADADATLTGTDANDIDQGMAFVSPEQMSALRAVIAKGQTVLGSSSTNSDAMGVIEELEAALDTFDNAKKLGKRKVSFDGIDIAIDLSNEYLNQVASGDLVVSDDGEDVEAGKLWVSTDAYNKLVAAVSQAQTAVGDQYISQDTADELAANMTAFAQNFEDNIKTKKSVERLWGTYSYDTSIAITSEGFTQSEYAIIARCDGFADAMSATGLAGALEAPILLTETDALTQNVADELVRLGVKSVYIIGGEGALSAQVESDIKALGMTTTRVAGYASWDTSVECARELKEVQEEKGITPTMNAVAVTTSYLFLDALSLSSFAYKYQVPIILETYDYELTSEALELLSDTSYYGTSDVYIPGGPVAVPTESVEETLDSNHSFTRIYGETGYDTSNEIACYMVEHELLGANNVCVAAGSVPLNGVDALSGSSFAGKNGSAIVLVNTEEDYGPINTTTIDGFFTKYKANINQAYVLGGPAAVGENLYDRLVAILN